MTLVRTMALCVLCLSALLSAGAGVLAPHDYSAQFREHAGEAPSRNFILGTDALGRDRFSRLLVGVRISLSCAAGAAVMATGIAALLGMVAGYFGGWLDEAAGALTDLFLSLPWLFAVLTLRALLPLNLSPWLSIAATFLLLGGVGWASGARVLRAGTAGVRDSAAILHARASGSGGLRLLYSHVLPNLKPLLAAQFWILVPVFLLTEANLGILGLGIVEPLPSLGNMLAELQNYERIPAEPWILAPAVLLILLVGSLHLAMSGRREWEQ